MLQLVLSEDGGLIGSHLFGFKTPKKTGKMAELGTILMMNNLED